MKKLAILLLLCGAPMFGQCVTIDHSGKKVECKVGADKKAPLDTSEPLIMGTRFEAFKLPVLSFTEGIKDDGYYHFGITSDKDWRCYVTSVFPSPTVPPNTVTVTCVQSHPIPGEQGPK